MSALAAGNPISAGDVNAVRHVCAAVLLCPPGDLRVAEEAVADSLGRSLVALRTSDLTAATVRALRGGLRIPPEATEP